MSKGTSLQIFGMDRMSWIQKSVPRPGVVLVALSPTTVVNDCYFGKWSITLVVNRCDLIYIISLDLILKKMRAILDFWMGWNSHVIHCSFNIQDVAMAVLMISQFWGSHPVATYSQSSRCFQLHILLWGLSIIDCWSQEDTSFTIGYRLASQEKTGNEAHRATNHSNRVKCLLPKAVVLHMHVAYSILEATHRLNSQALCDSTTASHYQHWQVNSVSHLVS